MNDTVNVNNKDVDRLFKRLDREAEESGYHLNPDTAFTKDLVKGLLVNEKRYGYWACPCRLASGDKNEDLDIICPCDYRDADLNEYGNCYCALYVSNDIKQGNKQPQSIPERRPEKEKRAQHEDKRQGEISKILKEEISEPIWRCRVCGYLCARKEPPEVCPICYAKKDRFERFLV